MNSGVCIREQTVTPFRCNQLRLAVFAESAVFLRVFNPRVLRAHCYAWLVAPISFFPRF